MSIISHITLGGNDYQASGLFYDAVLGTLGFTRLPKPEGKPIAYEKDGQMPTIYIYAPENGLPATFGNGTHIALIAQTSRQVQDFHAQAIAHGGSDEGAPGLRLQYGPSYYAAYVRDPDGNKLQAVCYDGSPSAN